MGLRGRLRDPNSRRGLAEAKRRAREAVNHPPEPRKLEPMPEQSRDGAPTYPPSFTPEQASEFNALVAKLIAADVPLKAVDSYAIAMTVRCNSAIETAEVVSNDADATIEQRLGALRLISGFGKDLAVWLTQICANPGARARIGLKAPPEKKGGKLAELLASRQART